MSVAEGAPRDQTVLEARVRIPQHVVHRSFVKETVVLNLNTGRYHGVNPTGGRMLTTLEEVGSVREAAARLAREYDQPLEQIERDLCEFCEALSERGLIELEPAA